MTRIALLTGEDADLPDKFVKDLSVSVFPYTVIWPSYTDSSSFYTTMRKSHKDAPRTSQPSIKTFKELFEDNLKRYTDILTITISSHLSGTYNAAIQARKLCTEKEQKRIYIFDSQGSSGSEALLILKAAQLISQGQKIETILEELKTFIRHIHFIGVFDDPQWLQKGGRINAVQTTLVRNMLKAGFRPILTIREGQIVTKKIQMNAKDKAEALFHQFKEEITSSDELKKPITVIITHSDCEKDAIMLKPMIEAVSKTIKIAFINKISSVIGSHLGPDALLLAWSAE